MFGIQENFVDQCIDCFGNEGQLDILQEECAELIKACSKVKRGDGHWTLVDPTENLIEELAHVAISSAVVAKIYGITEADIQKEVEKKKRKYHFVEHMEKTEGITITDASTGEIVKVEFYRKGE